MPDRCETSLAGPKASEPARQGVAPKIRPHVIGAANLFAGGVELTLGYVPGKAIEPRLEQSSRRSRKDDCGGTGKRPSKRASGR
jgi:hypothetical protein